MTVNDRGFPGWRGLTLVSLILCLIIIFSGKYLFTGTTRVEPPVPYWSFVSGHKNLSVFQVKQILDLTARCSAVTGVRQSILLSIIEVESDYEPDARANSDIGLCQINSKIWWFADFDIERNINGMCVILSHYLLFEHGSVYRAVRRYNGINSDTFASRVLSGARKIDEQK